MIVSKKVICLVIALVYFTNIVSCWRRDLTKEKQAEQYLETLEHRLSTACHQNVLSSWNFYTNITKETEDLMTEGETNFQQFTASIQKEILERFPDWEAFPNDSLRREFKYLSIAGPGNMPIEHVKERTHLMAKMQSAYSTAKVCEYKSPEKCNVRLNPELEEILKTKTDYDELAYYWTAWHDSVNKGVTAENYTKFMGLEREYAQSNDFNDMSEHWLQWYDDGTESWTAASFKNDMLDLWGKLKPYYAKLHAYVRMKLKKNPQYAEHIKADGYLPAHLLGNMWAQDWTALEKSTKPFPEVPLLDATEAMKKENYTVLKMFQESDKFFTGLGLMKMTDKFWKKTVMERPKDREIVCHASAEDFCLGKQSEEFAVKMCTKVNMDDFVVVHHEMGHIEYFMQYRDLHYVFRNGANPGFHEALGDTLALAVITPKHLQCVAGFELIKDFDCQKAATERSATTSPVDINFLFTMALRKFVFFPFAISMDSWRWEVQEGKINEDEYNNRWWELRKLNQGIVPPFERKPTSFDPAAKYHIPANVPYISYFVSHIIQFQFYEAMCTAAGEFKRGDSQSKHLHQCDFAGSKAAGKLLGDMMKLGFSKPWPEALNVITGTSKMDVTSLLTYYQPLFDYLDNELNAAGEKPCFGDNCKL